jgi:hypothetical protein
MSAFAVRVFWKSSYWVVLALPRAQMRIRAVGDVGDQLPERPDLLGRLKAEVGLGHLFSGLHQVQLEAVPHALVGGAQRLRGRRGRRGLSGRRLSCGQGPGENGKSGEHASAAMATTRFMEVPSLSGKSQS